MNYMHETSDNIIDELISVLNESREDQMKKRFTQIIGKDMPNSRTVAADLSEIAASNTDLEHTVTALLLYRAFQWMEGAEQIDTILQKCIDLDDKSDDLQETMNIRKIKSIVESTFETSAALHLRKREEYFSACKEIVKAIDAAMEAMRYSEEWSILNMYFTKTEPFDIKEATRYNVKKHLVSSVISIHTLCGKELDKAVLKISEDRTPDSGECAFLFHNVSILINEYIRILYRRDKMNDKAVKLLTCETEEDMMAVSEKESDYYEAASIANFVQLVTGAIQMLKECPEGNDCYMAIVADIKSKRSGHKMSDEQTAKSINMGRTLFKEKVSRGYTLLGAILWGCDIEALTLFIS